jgi:hypothetical protein
MVWVEELHGLKKPWKSNLLHPPDKLTSLRRIN